MTADHVAKFAAALPKGDLNGLDEALAEELYDDLMEGRSNRPRVALVVFDVKEAKCAADGTRTVMLRIRRVEPLITSEHRQSAEQMLHDGYTHRSGALMLPFELKQLSRQAFADLPRSHADIDEAEAQEQETMSDVDQLCRHLVVVHGREDMADAEPSDAERQHEADHAGELPEELAHKEEWRGWRRVDLEAATADSDEENSDERTGPPTADDRPAVEPDEDGRAVEFSGTTP